MFCKCDTKVLIECFHPEANLIVFGAGHVGYAFVNLASQLGVFNITVADDRPEFADADRFNGSINVVLTDRDYSDKLPEVNANSMVVIITRCHPTDKGLVKRYATSDAAYVGMIGSKSKRKILFKELEEEGVPKEALDRVRSPIGIQLGGKEPTEIAVSILAEIVKVKNEVFG